MDFKEIEKLVADAKSQNEISKERLVEEFTPFIINLSNRTFINGYNTKDIQNECFRILFRCVYLYKLERHRFVAYATNGIKNSINDLINKSKHRSSLEGFEALTLSDNLEHILPSDDCGLDEMLCNKTVYEELREALSSLDEEERELIIFIYLKNNSLQTYAYWKNMCYSTANRKKRKILDKMKQLIS